MRDRSGLQKMSELKEMNESRVKVGQRSGFLSSSGELTYLGDLKSKVTNRRGGVRSSRRPGPSRHEGRHKIDYRKFLMYSIIISYYRSGVITQCVVIKPVVVWRICDTRVF